MIHCLCGPPGAGKSHYYAENLSHLRLFDIADVYHDYPGIDHVSALSELLNRITNHLSGAGNDIAVEAVFKPGSIQRTWIEYIAECHDTTVAYTEFDTPLDVCLERIEADWKNCDQSNLNNRSRYNARKKIVDAYKEAERRTS
jgi:predicted kinase